MLRSKKFILTFYSWLFIGLLILGFILFFELQFNGLYLYFFDVGQGDAILIRTPWRQNILIDGGPDNTVIYKLGRYLPFYNREIDLMILTHPHADHLTGLVEVLKRYKVKRVLTTGVAYDSPDYLAWLNLIKEKNISSEIIDHQGKMILGNKEELEIFYPDKSFLDQKIKNLNNASIVIKLTYNQRSVMLTGDFDNEEELVAKELDLAADILKVGHHGSGNANDFNFLQAVSPALAIISCGQDNKFNHPSPEVIQQLSQLGIPALITYEKGDIVIKSDGQNLRLEK